MNFCAIQQSGYTSREEMMNFVSIAERKDSVVCPKPRRVGVVNNSFNDPSRPPLRWHFGYQAELGDARSGSELLDLILSKGGHVTERSTPQVASSPPFFCGSPPSRVANPLIQDARFREEKPLAPQFSPFSSSSNPSPPGPGSSPRKGGCVRASFGNNPAVRIEGFDCLDRDSRNCRISALA